jgi:hypothetical protein
MSRFLSWILNSWSYLLIHVIHNCVCVCVCIYVPVYNLHHQGPDIRTLMMEMDSISEMVLFLKHFL